MVVSGCFTTSKLFVSTPYTYDVETTIVAITGLNLYIFKRHGGSCIKTYESSTTDMSSKVKIIKSIQISESPSLVHSAENAYSARKSDSMTLFAFMDCAR